MSVPRANALSSVGDHDAGVIRDRPAADATPIDGLPLDTELAASASGLYERSQIARKRQRRLRAGLATIPG
jgi:hypothetical protein